MAISISKSPLPGVASTETITVRGVILGVLSIAGMSLYITHYGSALIKSYLRHHGSVSDVGDRKLHTQDGDAVVGAYSG